MRAWVIVLVHDGSVLNYTVTRLSIDGLASCTHRRSVVHTDLVLSVVGDLVSGTGDDGLIELFGLCVGFLVGRPSSSVV